jgi:hypothetical protein
MNVIVDKLNQINKSQSNTLIGGSSEIIGEYPSSARRVNVAPFVAGNKNVKLSVQSDIEIMKS